MRKRHPPKPQNQPAQSQPAQNQPAQSQPAQNQPAQDQPAQDQPAQSQPAQSQPAQNQPAQNPPVEDKGQLLEEVCDLDTLLKEEFAHDTKVQANANKKWDDTLAYPSLNEQAGPRFVTAGQARSGQLAPESATAHSLFSGTILDSLYAQTEKTLSEQEQKKQEGLRVQAQLDASLRRIFAFLNELVQQLNILKPAIPRVYPLADQQEFKNLVWQSGHVDYRSTSLHTATAELESVTLTYRLASDDPPLCLERRSESAEILQKKLFDLNLSAEVKKTFYDNRSILEKALFMIRPEIKTQVRWLGNPEDGRLRCETNNLERFGRLTWLLPVEAPMDIRFLNEFGHLLMGQKHDFPNILNRKPEAPQTS